MPSCRIRSKRELKRSLISNHLLLLLLSKPMKHLQLLRSPGCRWLDCNYNQAAYFLPLVLFLLYPSARSLSLSTGWSGFNPGCQRGQVHSLSLMGCPHSNSRKCSREMAAAAKPCLTRKAKERWAFGILVKRVNSESSQHPMFQKGCCKGVREWTITEYLAYKEKFPLNLR